MLLLYLSFPLLCILAIQPTDRPGGFATRIVFGLALYEFLLLAIGLPLGLSAHLTSQSYSILTWLVAIPLGLLSWRNNICPDLKPVVRWMRTWRGRAALLLAALMSAAFLLQFCFDAFYGTRQYDGLCYHIPRVMFWLQQQGFAAWTTPVWAQIGLPVAADLVIGQKILLGHGWRGAGFVTGLLSVGSIACVYIAALDLKLSRWHAAMAAIIFSSFPAIGLRIWTANSDIAAAFPVLAAYVVLHRVRNEKYGLAVFITLNAVAMACKPTIAPHAFLLGSVALWQCRHSIARGRSFALPCVALALGVVMVTASYWPVYEAFADFQGGDGGRAHKVASIAEFIHSVAMSASQWLLEPLGYLTPLNGDWVKGVAKTVYNFFGANLQELPESWKPWPSQDVGRTGLATVLMLPILLLGLSSGVRISATVLFLISFVSLSGMVHFQPWGTRYHVVLLAGYALLWGGTGIFRRGKGRMLLAGFVALNVWALLGVVLVRSYVDMTSKSRPGGAYHYLAENDRRWVATALAGRPLMVITGETLDALLVGYDMDYPMGYVICPVDGDWRRVLQETALRSNVLALVHNGRESMLTGPTDWHRPGSHTCPEIPLTVLADALTYSGWRLYKRNNLVDLWKF